MTMKPATQLKSVPIEPLEQQFTDTISVTGPATLKKFPDQSIKARLLAEIQAQSQSYLVSATGTVVNRIITLNLNGSEVGAPSAQQDVEDIRGYYVDIVVVNAWVQKPGETPDSNKALQSWKIGQEAPNTSNLTGTFSASMNYGFDAQGGLFGPIPTATAGANIGVSSSHSQTLTDYTFYQHSDLYVLHHNIEMTKCGDGQPYDDKNPGTLRYANYDPGNYGIKMRPLTGLAKSNIPIFSSVVWREEVSSDSLDKVTLHIALGVRAVIGEAVQGTLYNRFDGKFFNWMVSKDLDLSLLQL